MTTRETSRKAWEQMCASGVLNGRQRRALEYLIAMDTATSGEVIARMREPNVNLWRARFTELQARGLITEVGTRKCGVSGRSAIVWQFSGRTKPLEAQHRVGAAQLRDLLKRAAKLLQAHGGGAATSAAELLEEVRAAGVRV